MLQEFVRELVFNALNSNLPEPVVRVWRSALVLAIDKGRLHKEGPFKGQKALRPVVIGTALRRIAERVPAAQLRGRWAQLFARYRQFGVAVPSGVEIAYRQTELAIQKLHEMADGDRDQEPVCIQIDASDAYTRTSRPALIEACEEHMPSMLKYHRMAYGGSDEFVMLWQGQVIDVVLNKFGVWQGAPLGMHGFGLGNIKLMQSLFNFSVTHRMFDEDPGIGPALPAWIADDLTLVTRRKNALSLIDYILMIAPKSRFTVSLSKSEVLVSGPADEGVKALCSDIRQRGMTARRQGLRRLLGAPIGTRDFCLQSDGHLQQATTAAVKFVQAIATIGHSHAEYMLLRYCAASSLNHIPRLMDPDIVKGYAEQLWTALEGGARSLLGTTKVTDLQFRVIGLPMREGGWGWVSAKQNLYLGHVGSAGAVAKFFNAAMATCPEMKHLLDQLRSSGSVIRSMMAINEVVAPHARRVRFEPLDMRYIHVWPKQKKLANLYFNILANALEKDIAAVSRQAASWFASHRLRGGMAWLNVIPKLPQYQVSSELFRIMLGTATLVPVVGDMKVTKCVCGYRTASQLCTGIHWFSSCSAITLSTTMHNEVAECWRSMLREAEQDVSDAESANWFRQRPDLRPFDVVAGLRGKSMLQGWDIGITDPTRVGRLPAGTDYFKKGAAAARMASRKAGEYAVLVSMYGEPRPSIQHGVIVHEVSGGLGKKASNQLAEVLDIAKELKIGINYREEGAEHTWTANDFATKWVQRMSFTIVKFRAMTVLAGLRKAAMAAH